MASPGVEIRIENVHKSFGSRRVLDGVNLEVQSGELIAVVGGSGNGKSTLLRQIIGLDHPDEGRVLVADQELKDSRLVDVATLKSAGMESLERHWGVVFQGNALLSGQTVGFNIGIALREVQDLDEATVRTRVQNVLREVALDPDKDINLTTDQLSGGMAKRVAIARALALDPIQLFYDEPTTGLDPQVAETIQDLIGSVHRGRTASGAARTSLMITHDKEMLFRLQPRVVMLDAGRIVFDGTYEEFGRSDSPAIRPYFDLMPKLQQHVGGGSASAASRR
jgi:phospholipid/cholesterol/gamma-HCH transport system ATP-binding protein